MNIIPTPKRITPAVENAKRRIFAPVVEKNKEFSAAIDTFVSYMERMHNVNVKVEENGSVRVVCDKSMAQENYKIVITADSATIYAGDFVGVNHAFATLLQILQTDAENISLPEITIEDTPDCKYRGMMVDLARGWHPFSYLLTYVDMCYFYKVAVLHLHFTDDQSYTLPSDIFPKLSTENRSYSKEEIRELVEYAHARGVELMPEIDVPGHCISFGEAYGELFGTKGIICQHPDSMEAMKNLFGELCDMFPYSKYIHIGGDEAYAMEEWTKCPDCLAYAKSIGIDAYMEDKRLLSEYMYAHFVQEMADACFAKGKQPIAWEGFSKEVNDRVSKDILMMSWENLYQTTPDLLEAGFSVINCSWIPMYVVAPIFAWTPKEIFDWSVYRWKAKSKRSPYHEGAYVSQPTDKILGGQLLAWGDTLATRYSSMAEAVSAEHQLLLERLPMLAENTWNVTKIAEYDSFEETAKQLNAKLDLLMSAKE